MVDARLLRGTTPVRHWDATWYAFSLSTAPIAPTLLQTPILSTAHILYDVIVTHPSSDVCLSSDVCVLVSVTIWSRPLLRP